MLLYWPWYKGSHTWPCKLMKIQRIYVCSSCKIGDGDARVAEAMSQSLHHDSALAQRDFVNSSKEIVDKLEDQITL